MRRWPAVVLTASLAAGGVAVATWTATGAGTGGGRTGAPAPVVLSAGVPATSLHPGASADVQLRVTNPGAAEVRLPSLVLDPAHGVGGFAVDGGRAGCGVAAFSFDATAAAAGWTVPGGPGATLDVTLPGAVSMAVDAPDACQGASVTVYLEAGS